MDSLILSAATGFGIGIASTLHCAGMCGAIASSLTLGSAPCCVRDVARVSGLMHLGRIGAYTLAGIAVGAAGAPAIAWLDREFAFRLLQWAGAVALLWIGLSTAGLLPSLSALDRVLTPVANGLARLPYGLRSRRLSAFVGGFAWGLMPCAMVYGALFTAMLTGSAAGGGAVMLAFGAGTLPGLLAATFGIRLLADIGRRRAIRTTAGLLIALTGISTVWIQSSVRNVLCRPAAEIELSQINPIRPGGK